MASQAQPAQRAKVQPCRYKTGKTLGAGSYSVVKECVHIDTGRYFAAKVINKRLMSGREHMVIDIENFCGAPWKLEWEKADGMRSLRLGGLITTGSKWDRSAKEGVYGSPEHFDFGGLFRDHEQPYVLRFGTRIGREMNGWLIRFGI